ncbi:MAG TPA: magnesium transporter [Planctomycetota bacterium]|nr:magnesium transporter [Planctomycetota bacterium]
MNPLLIPELRELIQEKDVAQLRRLLEPLHPAHAADLIMGLKPQEISWALQVLDDAKEALIFEYLPEELQYELALGTGRAQMASLLNSLAPDDRAEFVRKLPTKVVDELLPLMAQAERNDVKRLLSFADGTAGSHMTTEYASVPAHLNCGEALTRVRNEAPDKETIYNIYLVDQDRHLQGVVGLKDLLLSRPDTPVDKIMVKEVVTVRADEPAVKAAESTAKFDLIAIPVVDDSNRLLGIVTVDDLMDVLEEEATEDILSLGGVEPGALDKPYFENPIALVVRKRVGWLMLLFVAEMFTGTVLRHYDEELAKVVALSFFIPLLIGTGGNAGSQTVSTIIRSLALKEITPAQWPQVLFREATTGLILGLLLGVVGTLRSLMWDHNNIELAATVGVTVVAICAWANSVAAVIPIFAQRAGLDPTVLSAPLITTLVDATGLLIYFSIAMAFISRLSEPVVAVPRELADRILALADAAPPDLSAKLRGLAQPPELHTHPHEWLFPLLALLVLTGVLFSMTRRTTKQA